jgi:pimeloyl-ACP methyl ester carboxylesterase
MKTRNFRVISTNGIHLRSVVEGQGPLVLMVHGYPESWYSYRHQIDPVIEAGYQVAVIDVRGYGGSDKPESIEAYSMRNMCADLAGVIDALGGAPAILIGHDWGAPIVWVTSILYPAKVRAAVGMSVPFLGRPRRPITEFYAKTYSDRFFYQLYFQQPGVAEREFEADIPVTIRKTYYISSGDALSEHLEKWANKDKHANFLDDLFDPNPLLPWLTPEDVAYYAEQFRTSGFRGPLNRYRNYERDWEELPELGSSKVTHPAFFIAGEKDPVLTFGGTNVTQIMHKYYQDLRGSILIPNVGHWVQQEAPQRVNREILRFLADIS